MSYKGIIEYKQVKKVKLVWDSYYFSRGIWWQQLKNYELPIIQSRLSNTTNHLPIIEVKNDNN
jgi:hypothetical protein